MNLKKMVLCVMICVITVFSVTGCAEDTSAADAELHSKMLGVWVPVPDTNELKDDAGNITEFSVYEFTETQTKYHLVKTETTETRVMNEYTITGGKYKVMENGAASYAIVSFDENGNLIWTTDLDLTTFRPVTDEEFEEFFIPTEAEIGTQASDNTELSVQ